MVKSFQAVSQTPLRCKAIHNEDNTPELTLPQSLYLTRPMYFSTNDNDMNKHNSDINFL